MCLSPSKRLSCHPTTIVYLLHSTPCTCVQCQSQTYASFTSLPSCSSIPLSLYPSYHRHFSLALYFLCPLALCPLDGPSLTAGVVLLPAYLPAYFALIQVATASSTYPTHLRHFFSVVSSFLSFPFAISSLSNCNWRSSRRVRPGQAMPGPIRQLLALSILTLLELRATFLVAPCFALSVP
jgi:hypothetical protein